MPKVKKKSPVKSKRKSAKKKSPPGVFATLSGAWTRLLRASMAAGVLIVLLAAVILWSSGYFGVLADRAGAMMHAGAVSAGFEVRRVTVIGQDQTSARELRDALGEVMGTSIFSVDPVAARERVEEIGWVRSAAVARLYPDTIHISVRERAPAAVWQNAGDFHLIDVRGAVIKTIDSGEYSNLPLVVGAGASDTSAAILQVLRAEPALWGRGAALIRVGDRRWNLRTLSGYDIKFPERGFGEAVDFLARLHDKTGILDEPVEYIDLRNPENFVYRLNRADEAQLQAG